MSYLDKLLEGEDVKWKTLGEVEGQKTWRVILKFMIIRKACKTLNAEIAKMVEKINVLRNSINEIVKEIEA